jgi:glycerol-3-phosphate dehydrogenase (NAD(P)+)
MRVGLIGLGNLGTAVGSMIAENGFDVLGWEYHQEAVNEINELHLNSRFLPGVNLHENLRATTDITAVFDNCEVIFIAIPSVFIESTLAPFQGKVGREIVFVNMAKGIDREKGLTSFQVLSPPKIAANSCWYRTCWIITTSARVFPMTPLVWNWAVS